MSDSTNLDLWQSVSTVGSADLDLGASPDVVPVTVGTIDGFNIGAPEYIVGDFVQPLTLIATQEPATISSMVADYIVPATVAINCNSPAGVVSGTVILCGVIDAEPSALRGVCAADIILQSTIESNNPIQTISVTGSYDQNVTRDPTGLAGDVYAKANKTDSDILTFAWDTAGILHNDLTHVESEPYDVASAVSFYTGAIPSDRQERSELYSEADTAQTTSKFLFEGLLSGSREGDYTHTEADTHSADKSYLFYDTAPRVFNDLKDSFESALKLVEMLVGEDVGLGAHLSYTAWSDYQQAGYPASGRSQHYVPPVVDPVEVRTDLDLAHEHDGTTNLEFYWADDAVHVIPVKKAYLIMNEVKLYNVATSAELPLLSMSLDLDRDSWAWGFKVSLPYSCKDLLIPVELNSPLVLDLSVNGTVFRVLAEKVTTSRTFGNKTLNVSGRGISAYLSSPYAATQTFTSTEAATAQQLMNTALTYNGASLGWEIDWQITDWTIPASAYSVRGTYIDVIKEISAAAGAFILPDTKNKKLSIVPTYPAAPWDWGNIQVDYHIPSSVAEQDGVDWVEKPAYNSLYLTGNSGGILAQVKKAGTAGNYNAPAITDALITDVAAARQRGITELSQTGLMSNVKITLPILPETGIILPGKILRYADGANEIIGVTKGVTLSKSLSSPLRQEVEMTVHG